jgi:hypothetical protein
VRAGWLLVVAIGCGGASGPPCADVAANTKVLVALNGGVGNFTTDLDKHFRTAIEHRCEVDNWSAEARTCFRHADSFEGLTECRNVLSAEQANKLSVDIVIEQAIAERRGSVEVPAARTDH